MGVIFSPSNICKLKLY